MTTIHDTAIVSPDAELHDSVTVGPYCIIEAGVQIGAGTTLGSHCVIRSGTTIGERNHIHQFASVGDDPQDKKYAGEDTRLVIGNGNTIREFCTLNRGTTQDEGVTTIGDNNWLMAYVHVAHDCVVGNEIVLANSSTLAGHVHVDDYVIMGGFAGAHQFCRIGAHAFVANNCAVTRDVPPYVMAAGQPAVPRGINSEGLKRRGFSSEQIRNIKDAFRLMYRAGLRLEEAREQINAVVPQQQELAIFADFIKSSERSFVR